MEPLAANGPDKGRRDAPRAHEPAAEFPNVFLEWCGGFCSTRRWEETLQKVPVAQVVYGSDAAAHDIHWEMGRLLSLDVPGDTIAAILGQNLGRVLTRRQTAERPAP